MLLPNPDGAMKFSAVVKPLLRTVKGEGTDSCGRFRIFGTIDENILCFLKQYINCNGNAAWSYTGRRISDDGKMTFDGEWGNGHQDIGYWTLSVTEQPSDDF